MKKGVYYVPEENYIILLLKILPTIIVDRNGIDGRVWSALWQNDENMGVSYIDNTNDYVYIGEL